MFGLFTKAATQPIEAIGKILDNIITTPGEVLDKKAIMERLAQKPYLAQIELNKIEAQHRSLFVAGWRPFIGWVCGVGLSFPFVINPLFQWLTGQPGPDLPISALMSLVTALLGLGGLRTVEKLTGRTK